MVYKHVIGLKTDASQSNLGGNTDSNHLIPGVVGHFPSVSLRRRPIQLVILIPFFFSPASDAGFLRFVRGSLAPRCFFVLFPAVFRGFLSSFPRHRMPAFLCSVPLPVSRPLFLFCRMLSGLFVCLFPGIECQLSSFCSRVFNPALFICSVPRGIPRFPFFFSPASDAGVLPPLWRGRVFPFTVQSRDHLATITDIYVPSFPYVHSPAFNAGFYFVHSAV